MLTQIRNPVKLALGPLNAGRGIGIQTCWFHHAFSPGDLWLGSDPDTNDCCDWMSLCCLGPFAPPPLCWSIFLVLLFLLSCFVSSIEWRIVFLRYTKISIDSTCWYLFAPKYFSYFCCYFQLKEFFCWLGNFVLPFPIHVIFTLSKMGCSWRDGENVFVHSGSTPETKLKGHTFYEAD